MSTLPASNDASKKNSQPYPKMIPIQGSSKPEYLEDGSTVTRVPGIMNYVTDNTNEVNVYRDVKGHDSEYIGAEWDQVEVPIHNARLFPHTPSLDKEGFELLVKPVTNSVDFLDQDSVIDNYYPECEEFLKSVLDPKAQVVKCFDHNVRVSYQMKKSNDEAKRQGQLHVPLGMVHGDYTKTSGPNRFKNLCQPPKANDILKSRLKDKPLLDPMLVDEMLEGKRRFQLINIWRNIDPEEPVQQFPLACVDASTSPASDGSLKTLYLHYSDRIGENYFVSHRKQHKWCYFPRMTHDEALLIKQWDSRGAIAREDDESDLSTFSIHSAFHDATSTGTSPPRKSIEVRCAVIWQEEN